MLSENGRGSNTPKPTHVLADMSLREGAQREPRRQLDHTKFGEYVVKGHLHIEFFTCIQSGSDV